MESMEFIGFHSTEFLDLS